MPEKYKNIFPWNIKPKYFLLAAMVFLVISVLLEEFIPGWDDNRATDILAVVQAMAIGGLGFILGRTWNE